jgi:hypothetical protein
MRAFVVALFAFAGCGADPYVTIADWNLKTPDGKSHAVHAPQRLDELLPKHPITFVLEAEVTLPEALRARTLTLTWENVDAFATLSVDGEPILPLSVSPFDRFRPSERELVFRIPESKTSRETLHLELAVQHVDVWTMSTGLAPRLAAAPYGERQARVTRYIDHTIAIGMTAIFLLLALAAGVSFLLDRRRSATGGLR